MSKSRVELPELIGIEQNPDARPYNVVERTLTGPLAGVFTWTQYASKDAYHGWRSCGKMQDGRPVSQAYAPIAEGVSMRDAERLCDNANSLDLLLGTAKKRTEEIDDPALRTRVLELEIMKTLLAHNRRTPNEN